MEANAHGQTHSDDNDNLLLRQPISLPTRVLFELDMPRVTGRLWCSCKLVANAATGPPASTRTGNKELIYKHGVLSCALLLD